MQRGGTWTCVLVSNAAGKIPWPGGAVAGRERGGLGASTVLTSWALPVFGGRLGEFRARGAPARMNDEGCGYWKGRHRRQEGQATCSCNGLILASWRSSKARMRCLKPWATMGLFCGGWSEPSSAS